MSKKKKTTANPPPAPEWSHKVDIEVLGPNPFHLEITATPEQCRDVARRVRVQAVDNLRAKFAVERRPRSHIIHVSGEVAADVTQTCVLTLEPLHTRIEEAAEGWYSDEEHVVSLARARREQQTLMAEGEIPMPEEKDDPEPVVDGRIDVGELAIQYLSLAIDPYPRKEGVSSGLTDEAHGVPVKEKAWQNPFAALKDWKAKKDG